MRYDSFLCFMLYLFIIIVTLNSSSMVEADCTPDELKARYQAGFEDGKDYCMQNPSECGVVEDNCIQIVTYGRIPSIGCWVKFDSPCDIPQGWDKTYETPEGLCSSYFIDPNTNNCATVDKFLNLNIPCVTYGGYSYHLSLDSFESSSESNALYWKFNTIREYSTKNGGGDN
ncbi:MAG: hypothetical protein U9N81_08485 [Bacillota bacterium]|nr:hypothetical protein [Bacillota bacterium]